jgi:hypothetical protein
MNKPYLKIYNDCKERDDSWEASIEDIRIDYGYGATPEEAKDNLLLLLTDLIHDLIKLESDLKLTSPFQGDR